MARINEIRGLLRLEKEHTLGSVSPLHVAKIALTRDSAWLRWRFVRYMRLQQYSCGLLNLYYSTRKNILGNKLGFEMSGDNIGEGVYLIHNGPIVINSAAVLGKGVKLHGDNCIGNDGISDDCPFIGDGVDIGVGAKVLGGGLHSERLPYRCGSCSRQGRTRSWERSRRRTREGDQNAKCRRVFEWLSRHDETVSSSCRMRSWQFVPCPSCRYEAWEA